MTTSMVGGLVLRESRLAASIDALFACVSSFQPIEVDLPQSGSSSFLRSVPQKGVFKLLSDCVGDHLAGDGDVHGVLLIREDGEHDEQIAHRDAALSHIPIFPGLYARRLVCDTEIVTQPGFPLQLTCKVRYAISPQFFLLIVP